MENHPDIANARLSSTDPMSNWEDLKTDPDSEWNCISVQCRRTPTADPKEPKLRVIKKVWLHQEGGSNGTLAELDLMMRLARKPRLQEFLVKLFGWYDDEVDVGYYSAVAMEYHPLGNIRRCAEQEPGGSLPENLVRSVASQLMTALRYIHEEDCAHGSVKAENILVVSKEPPTWHIKLCYPWVRYKSGSTENESMQESLQPLVPSVQQRSDIYYAALTLFNLLAGFPDSVKGIEEFIHFLLDKHVSVAALKFVIRLADPDQWENTTAEQVLQDEWFLADETSSRHGIAE